MRPLSRALVAVAASVVAVLSVLALWIVGILRNLAGAEPFELRLGDDYFIVGHMHSEAVLAVFGVPAAVALACSLRAIVRALRPAREERP